MIVNFQKFLLLLSILIVILLNSCSPKYIANFSKTEDPSVSKPTVLDTSIKKFFYKSDLQILGNELSGTLIIKRFNEDELRFVFVSELGLKYFDLSIIVKDNALEYKTHYLMTVLDRGNLSRIIFDNFSKIVDFNTYNLNGSIYTNAVTGNYIYYSSEASIKTYYFFKSDEMKIKSIKWKNKVSGDSEILISDYSMGKAERIKIINSRYNFKMLLKKLP